MIVLVCSPASPALSHELWYNAARGIILFIP